MSRKLTFIVEFTEEKTTNINLIVEDLSRCELLESNLLLSEQITKAIRQKQHENNEPK